MSITEIYLNRYNERPNEGFKAFIDMNLLEVARWERTQDTRNVSGAGDIVLSILPFPSTKLFGYFVRDKKIFIILGRKVFRLESLKISIFIFPLLPIFLLYRKDYSLFHLGLEPFPDDEMDLNIVEGLKFLITDQSTREHVISLYSVSSDH